MSKYFASIKRVNHRFDKGKYEQIVEDDNAFLEFEHDLPTEQEIRKLKENGTIITFMHKLYEPGNDET